MNIVQINKFIEKIANCTELVNSFYTDSVYECWNAKEDIQYGSLAFCIKKTRMRENTMIYDAVIYYGDRLMKDKDDKSNRDAILTDANEVIQSIVGTVNNVEGEITISYPYEIVNFEQKFADDLAGAYANISIEVEGVGECGELLYGYESSQEGEIKLESIVKTITVNGEYDIYPSADYDAIRDVRVVVDVIPVISDENIFARAGYTDENAGHYFDYFNEALDYAYEIKENWDPNETSMYIKFEDDKKLVYMPMVDTSNVTNMSSMFNGCSLLTTIPLLDTSNVPSMYGMFLDCKNLTSIPQLDTSKVTNMERMFQGCSSLTTIPQLNTSKVTSTRRMFYDCDSLTTIPQLDTSNVTSMEDMFYDCDSLTTIPQLDTSNVTSMQNMFYRCYRLTTIPLLDCSSVTSTQTPFMYSSNLNNLTDLGGFKDLKVSWSSNFLDRVPNATVESLMNVINNLYDLTANGLSGKTISFGTKNLNKLTDDQKAIAINKGWTLK